MFCIEPGTKSYGFFQLNFNWQPRRIFYALGCPQDPFKFFVGYLCFTKPEWMSNGNWACVVSVPGGMKNDIIDKVASRSPDVEVRELD